MAKTGKLVTLRWPAVAALVAIIAIQLWGASHAADSRRGEESDSDYWLRVMRTGRSSDSQAQRGTKTGLGGATSSSPSTSRSDGSERRRRRSSRSSTGSGGRKQRKVRVSFDRKPKGAYTAQRGAGSQLPVEVSRPVQEPTTPSETAPRGVSTEAATFYDNLKDMLNKMGFQDGGAVPVGGESVVVPPTTTTTQFPYGTGPYTLSSAQNYYYPMHQVQYGGEVPQDKITWSNLMNFFGPSVAQTKGVVDSEASDGGEATGSEDGGVSTAESIDASQKKNLPMLWYRRETPVKTTHGVYHATYPYQPAVQPVVHPVVQPVYPQIHYPVQPAPVVGTHSKESRAVHNLVVVPVEKPAEPQPDVEVSIPEPEEPKPTSFVHVQVKPLPKVRTVGMALRRRREDLSLAFHHGSVAPSAAMWSILKVVVNFKEAFPLSFYKELSDGTSIWIMKVNRLCEGLQGGDDDARRAGLFLALYYWRFLAEPEVKGKAKRVVLVLHFDVDLPATCSSLLNSFLEGLLVNPNEVDFQPFRSASTAEDISQLTEKWKGADCEQCAMKSLVSDLFVIPPPSGTVSLTVLNLPMMSNCTLWFSRDPSFDDMKQNLLKAIVGDTGDVEEAKAALPECYGGTNNMALTDAPCERKLLSLIYNLIGSSQVPPVGGDSSQNAVGPVAGILPDNGGYQYPGWDEWFNSGNLSSVVPVGADGGNSNVDSIQNGVGFEARGIAGKVFPAVEDK